MKIMEKSNAIGYCLTKIPTILDVVLNKLNAKDLSSASCVCWIWHASAQRIWHKRFCLLFKLQHDLDYNKKSMSVMCEELCKHIEASIIFPSVAIMYVSRCEEYFSRRFSKHIKKVIRNVTRFLPKTCKLFPALGGGIIGTNDALSCEMELCEGISSMFLARSSAISVHDFFFSLKDVRSASRNIEDCTGLFSCSQISDVKLVLLNACSDADVVEDAVKIIVKMFGENVIIAGGFVESLFHQGKLYSKGISGLLFAGNLTANLLIHETKRNEEGFMERDKEEFFKNLQTLKASFSRDRISAIFMYACVARGHDLYSEHNVQTQLISEVFPQVPVIGMFAFGEIGYCGAYKANGMCSSTHSYSTVLCLCQF